MAQAVMELIAVYNQFWEDNIDPRNKDLPLMGGPLPIAALVAAYLYFISDLGPKLMRSRQPMELKWFMHFYNSIQVMANAWLVYVIVAEVWIPWRLNFWCEGIEVSYERVPLLIARTVYVYFLLKILDFIDTIIMVLRKKDKQASFLHKYHHVLVCIGAWIAAAILPGGSQMVFFGTMNCTIHMIMYTYYSATVVNPELRQCKYKRHLTEMQLVQFVLSGIHTIVGYFHPTCTFPKWGFVAYLPQNVFMIVMFTDFYINAYIKPKKRTKKSQ